MRHWCARPPSRNDNVKSGPGLSVISRPGTGRGARGAGAAMAAVFDLDLETEEGSEGEGEPEFSTAVSGRPRNGSIPEPIPSPEMGSLPLPPPRVGSASTDPDLSQIPAPVKL